jgi:hypothetical protein
MAQIVGAEFSKIDAMEKSRDTCVNLFQSFIGQGLAFRLYTWRRRKFPSDFYQDLWAPWKLTSPAVQNACCTATKDLISLIVPVL